MWLIPAIDLKDGKCVRLRQGKMEDETVFADDPLEVAQRWVEAGARRLHLVDLNGAFAGRPVNADPIHRIADAFPDVPIQVGLDFQIAQRIHVVTEIIIREVNATRYRRKVVVFPDHQRNPSLLSHC